MTAVLGNPAPATPRRRLVLAVLVLALQAVILDTSVLNVALKTLSEPAPAGLGANQPDLQWALDSYTLIFAGLLFTWGLLADRIGRKRVLLIGLTVFGLSSVLCAYAGTPGELVAARALLGLGGAAVMASTLALVVSVFPRDEQAAAIGIWTGSAGLAIAAGPAVGGALLDRFWWGSVFLINVPIVAATLLGAAVLIPESRNPNPRRVDPAGVLLLLTGLVAFTYGVIQGGETGTWSSAAVWGPILAGLAAAAVLVAWELHTDHPALDVRVFRNRRFSAAVISVLLTYFALMGGMFLFTFYLQSARGLTPLQAGLWSLPFAAAQLIFSPLSSRIVERFGARAVTGVSLTGIGAAFLGYQLADAASPLWEYGLAAFVQGAFTAIVMPSATTTVLTSLPPEQSGMGSSVTSTVRQVGGAVGVAVLGSALATGYRRPMEPLLRATPGVPANSAHQAGGSIQATQGLVERIVATHPQAAGLLEPAKHAFLHAMHLTTLSTAAVLMAAGVLWPIARRRHETVRRTAGTAHAQATPVSEG